MILDFGPFIVHLNFVNRNVIYLVLFGFTAITGICFNNPDKIAPAAEGINWITFDQLADSMKVKPKRVFIKISTEWCGPCKMMDKKVMTKARITEPLGMYYYSIAFDAEQTSSIKFKDSTFTFNPQLGPGTHNLAYHLGKEAGHMYYPTIVILDENLDILYTYPGVMNVTNLEEVLYLYKDLQK
jgi:thioredoxin-related protein